MFPFIPASGGQRLCDEEGSICLHLHKSCRRDLRLEVPHLSLTLLPFPPPAFSHLLTMARVFFITGTTTGFGYELVKHVIAQGDIAVATSRNPAALSFEGTTPKVSPILLSITFYHIAR